MTRWQIKLLISFLVVLSAVIIRFFVVSTMKIATDLMNPTLIKGDIIFVQKIKFDAKLGSVPVTYGDIAVVSVSEQYNQFVVSRVLALPGDKVEIQKGKLFINDTEVKSEIVNMSVGDSTSDVRLEKHPYFNSYNVIHAPSFASYSMAAMVIPPNEVFLMNDDRIVEDNAPPWNIATFDQLIGKTNSIWFSIQKGSGIKPEYKIRWDRLFLTVH